MLNISCYRIKRDHYSCKCVINFMWLHSICKEILFKKIDEKFSVRLPLKHIHTKNSDLKIKSDTKYIYL